MLGCIKNLVSLFFFFPGCDKTFSFLNEYYYVFGTVSRSAVDVWHWHPNIVMTTFNQFYICSFIL